MTFGSATHVHKDDTALARLAALDSTAVPAPPLLVADVGAQLRAALSLVSSKVIADPFNLTGWNRRAPACVVKL